MATKKQETAPTVELLRGRVGLRLLGTTPLIFNAMAEKARLELLIPRGRKTKVERASTLKHVPLDEFRNSTYQHRGDDPPTRLYFPSGGFKKAAMQAALRTAGMNKTETGQTLWVEGLNINIYGAPQIFLAPVKSGGMSKTPDIRTRAILPVWAAEIWLVFIKPSFSSDQVFQLIANAGLVSGIGDWRPERGGGFGMYDVVGDDDARFAAVLKNGGREAQDAALADPVAYDTETEKLLTLYDVEVGRIGDRIKRVA